MLPDYLRDADPGEAEVNFADLGLQLTRTTRGIKLWLSLKHFGVDAFRRTIDRTLDLAAAAQARIEASPELELLAPATLGTVCFRRVPPGVTDEEELAALNGALVVRLAESGVGMISSTRIDDRYALRLCILNHTSTSSDVEEVIGFMESEPVEELTETADVVAHALTSGQLERSLRGLPLYSRDAQLAPPAREADDGPDVEAHGLA
jgi:glutamate/tyrosine decarboxylase-like PLP-dependent enzyme